jgi:hypothetical protein
MLLRRVIWFAVARCLLLGIKMRLITLTLGLIRWRILFVTYVAFPPSLLPPLKENPLHAGTTQSITLINVAGNYQSSAKTATHIREAACGAS